MTLETTHEITTRVIELAEAELASGAHPQAIASALLGCGADLLRKIHGKLDAARVVHSLSLDLLRIDDTADDGDTRH
jgi:hypothetical protein